MIIRPLMFLGPGRIVVINLTGPTVREVIGCDQRAAARVLRLVAHRKEMLMNAWRRWPG
jgi:hypothetical protein